MLVYMLSVFKCAFLSAEIARLSIALRIARLCVQGGRRLSAKYGSVASYCLVSAVAKNHAAAMFT